MRRNMNFEGFQADREVSYSCNPHLVDTLERMVDLALKGELTTEWLSPRFPTMKKDRNNFIMRDYYVYRCAWAIFTKDWIDAMENFMREHGVNKIVEVCCGSGMLGPIFRERGFDWISSDEQAPEEEHVLQEEALLSVKKHKPDMVFASWIPYRSTLDYDLACLISEMKIPMILVGEGHGGCTGSSQLWSGIKGAEGPDWSIEQTPVPTPYHIEHYPLEEDVAQWNGLHDMTTLILPQ
ncbi:MAG: hypothetical protein CL582_23190 [Alteromonadaceae bacterium]|nr:hypothetical protein [Alteromonadaceae bacterium]